MYRKIQEIISTVTLSNNQKSDDSSNALIIRWVALGFFSIIILIALLMVINYIGHSAKPIPAPLGTYGDFFGGILNPILTFFTLIGLCITIIIQRMQLHDAKKEIKRNIETAKLQSFETTFFNMLEQHNQIVREIHFEIKGLSKIWDLDHHGSSLEVRFRHLEEGKGRQAFSQLFIFLDAAVKHGCAINQASAYHFIQKKYNHVFGHYFRNLYQILKFVQKASSERPIGFDEKFYSNILRAQLSSDELRALLYNCSEALVDDGNFLKLLVHFNFLEHLPLLYDRDTNKLLDINGGEADDELYSQYFKYRPIYGHGRWTSGAFGSNPDVDLFLKATRGNLKFPKVGV